MTTLSWALDRIKEWWSEAGESRVPDRERLQAVLRSLHRRRAHAGFVLYLVLACERLFRMAASGASSLPQALWRRSAGADDEVWIVSSRVANSSSGGSPGRRCVQ